MEDTLPCDESVDLVHLWEVLGAAMFYKSAAMGYDVLHPQVEKAVARVVEMGKAMETASLGAKVVPPPLLLLLLALEQEQPPLFSPFLLGEVLLLQVEGVQLLAAQL